MIVNLQNPTTNQLKQCNIGISWTTFLFGFLVPLFRGDWKWFIIMLIFDIMGWFTFGIVAFVANLVFTFIYNKIYVQDLIKKGFRPTDDASKTILQQNGFYTVNQTEAK